MTKQKKIRRNVLAEIDQKATMPDRSKGFVSIDNSTIAEMIERKKMLRKAKFAKTVIEASQ